MRLIESLTFLLCFPSLVAGFIMRRHEFGRNNHFFLCASIQEQVSFLGALILLLFGDANPPKNAGERKDEGSHEIKGFPGSFDGQNNTLL